ELAVSTQHTTATSHVGLKLCLGWQHVWLVNLCNTTAALGLTYKAQPARYPPTGQAPLLPTVGNTGALSHYVATCIENTNEKCPGREYRILKVLTLVLAKAP
ncbi:MAG: hypothetical protein EAY75_06185, partial [Bacteroidetes bacterium]